MYMNLGKVISAWFNAVLCFFMGHTTTFVCQRCGKIVNLENTRKLTLEERINGYFARKVKGKGLYVGRLKKNPHCTKYELNLVTNKLRKLEVESETIWKKNADGTNATDKDGCLIIDRHKYSAKYDPCCVYIDAINDKNAIRKANNFLFGRKRGITIKEVTP
jgi:hypothetical protein